MQLVRLTTKAHTPRNVPLRSPEKLNPLLFNSQITYSWDPQITQRQQNLRRTYYHQISSKLDRIRLAKIKTQVLVNKLVKVRQSIKNFKCLNNNLKSQNSTTNKLSNITALQTSSTKHKHHRSELTQDTCSEQPSTPTLTVPILKYVEHSGNMSQGQMFNKSNKLVGSITFQNGLYYVGEMVKFQDVLTIDGSGTLYTDNSKFYVVYEGRWKNNCFHGRGKYYNQYQIESSNDWHFNWKMIQAIFNKGEIIEGKIDFYLNEDSIAHQIEYSK